MLLLKRSAKNTLGCLLGCAIGDLGTIFAFQIFYQPESIPRDLWTVVWTSAMIAEFVQVYSSKRLFSGNKWDRYKPCGRRLE